MMNSRRRIQNTKNKYYNMYLTIILKKLVKVYSKIR